LFNISCHSVRLCYALLVHLVAHRDVMRSLNDSAQSVTSHSIRTTEFLLLFCLLTARPSNAKTPPELMAKDVVFALRSSLSSYDSAECQFSTYFKSLQQPETEKGPGGMGLYSIFQWGWLSGQSKEYLRGKWGFPRDDRFHYGTHQIAYDGTKLRTLNESDRGGRIAEVGDFFIVWPSPLTLLGRSIAEAPNRDLLQLLEDEKQIELVNSVPSGGNTIGQPQIKVKYRQGDQKCILQITCDPNAGFLPCRLEVVHDLTRCVMVRIETNEFTEVSPDVWFPLKGSIERFYVSNPPPRTARALSKKRLAAMPEEDARRLLSSIQWKTKSLGYGKQFIIVEPDSLKVNGYTSTLHDTFSSLVQKLLKR